MQIESVNVNAPDEPSNESVNVEVEIIDSTDEDKNFKASIGWVQNFVRRNELGSYILKGEKGSNDYEAAEEFTQQFTIWLGKEQLITVKNVLKNRKERYKSLPLVAFSPTASCG